MQCVSAILCHCGIRLISDHQKHYSQVKADEQGCMNCKLFLQKLHLWHGFCRQRKHRWWQNEMMMNGEQGTWERNCCRSDTLVYICQCRVKAAKSSENSHIPRSYWRAMLHRPLLYHPHSCLQLCTVISLTTSFTLFCLPHCCQGTSVPSGQFCTDTSLSLAHLLTETNDCT